MHVSTLISYLHYIDMYFTDFKKKKVGTHIICKETSQSRLFSLTEDTYI